MISTYCRPSLSKVATLVAWGLLFPLAVASAVAEEGAASADKQPASPVESESASPESEAKKQEEEKPQTLVVAEKRLVVTLPARWKQKERSNRMIDAEFEVRKPDAKEESPPTKDVAPVGRLTLSASGGGVEQNMHRWVGQFRLGHDAGGKDAIRQEELEIDGAKVHLVDIAGTYFDAPQGPLGPKVERADYRMLGAIVEIEKGGLYFVKFYGPKDIVEANAKDFRKTIEDLRVKSEEEAKQEKEESESARQSATASSDDSPPQ